MADIAWDARCLQVDSDSPWKAQYRLLQSYYREKDLGVGPGKQPPATERERARSQKKQNEFLGNLLPADEVEDEPALNFLMRPEIAEYAEVRARLKGGSIERTRLFHNMLSSMPLCFNLFGYLRFHPDVAAIVLRELLALDIRKIEGTGILLKPGCEGIEVEEAPPPKEHLNDRTSFDAFIEYRTSKPGERGFLAIETKYTEPFSKTVYKAKEGATDKYETATSLSGLFKENATKTLQKAPTNQLWRNILLADSLRRQSNCALAHVVIVACRDDIGARAAVEGLRNQLKPPADRVLKAVALEDLVTAFAAREEVAEWALQFRRRYLDLTLTREPSS